MKIAEVASLTFAIVIIRYELLNLRNLDQLKLRDMSDGFYNGRIHESSHSEDGNVDYYYRRMYTLDYVGGSLE